MRVIVDTSIIVSGLISPTGPPGKIVDALLQGFLVPVMSQATLAELEAVLMRPRLRTLFEHAGVEAMNFLAEFRELAEIVVPDLTDIPVRDENDRIFLELAAGYFASLPPYRKIEKMRAKPKGQCALNQSLQSQLCDSPQWGDHCRQSRCCSQEIDPCSV